jgi:hypothetical protein
MIMKNANKETKGKLRYDLVCPFALEEMVKVLTYGAEKYDLSDLDVNYQKPHSYHKLYAATQRHLNKWLQEMKGDDDGTDKDTELSHLAHAMANIMIMLHQETHGKFIERQ